jgi:hypothetical protein
MRSDVERREAAVEIIRRMTLAEGELPEVCCWQRPTPYFACSTRRKRRMSAPGRGEVWIVDRLHPGQVTSPQAVTAKGR